MSEVLFEVRGVGKAFGSNVLLENADLQVFKGETLAIIGDSGSGKSVFLKMLAGLLPVDDGQILYKGQVVGDMDGAALDHAHAFLEVRTQKVEAAQQVHRHGRQGMIAERIG